jgi:hypothetical protein
MQQITHEASQFAKMCRQAGRDPATTTAAELWIEITRRALIHEEPPHYDEPIIYTVSSDTPKLRTYWSANQ